MGQQDPRLKNAEYERGEGRKKHLWKRDEAGFVPRRAGSVGKCHSSISQEVARKLLREGIPEPSPFDDGIVRKVYNLYRGIPYVAVPTIPGRSFHGYPWRGRMPRSIKEELARRAEAQGTGKEFKKWLRRYEER